MARLNILSLGRTPRAGAKPSSTTSGPWNNWKPVNLRPADSCVISAGLHSSGLINPTHCQGTRRKRLASGKAEA